ncbi:MAG: glycerol-3-phosphate dehydrogenase/oxidase [Deltaproteobacteria bacterium]|nr:MAG: glycerol-3-phosphate dehydrogenase/oxidase [Deltaproteobacteria bacterium]
MADDFFSPAWRRRALARAAEDLVDVAVVGGGITGAGIAREAALRGLSVVLLERGDFASGTSSRSSKLIHGGVRYLAQGDVGLVREAARERAVLRRIAPHLARPTTMLIPARSTRGRLKLSAGLWAFARLAGRDAEAGHRVLDRSEALEAEPLLRDDRLAGAVTFTEFATDDARLTLETVMSAATAGALAANYAEVTGGRDGAAGICLDAVDRTTGESLEVRARVVVNASGPWLDEVAGRLGDGGGRTLELTRGIHLVFPASRIPVRHSVVLPAPDGRSAFIVPAGDVVYAGTTDTLYDGDPAEPGVDSADAAYLLEALAAVLRDPPAAGEAIGVWSGVRPLVRQPGKAPSEISRRDEIRVGPGPRVAIAGGKLTTYRKMAERVVARVVDLLGGSGSRADTSEVALVGGGAAEQQAARARAPELPDRRLCERLWATYGARAEDLIRRVAADPNAAERIGGIEELTAAEIEYFVTREMALTVDDVLRRRSRVAMFDGERATAVAGAVAEQLARYPGCAAWAACPQEAWTEMRSRELAAVRAAGAAGTAAPGGGRRHG